MINRLRACTVVVVLAACVAILPLGAQDTGTQDTVPADLDQFVGEGISVRTAGGGSFQGIFIGLEPDRIELLLPDGQILLIARQELAGFTIVDQSEGSRSFYEDSASNRLVIMPTAFPMDKGEFQVADQEIAAVTGSYGINDWLSVWGGISVPGALFSLRASVQLGAAVGASVGSFVGASWFDLSLGPLVLPYALVSFGEDNNNVTVGSGIMMTFSDGFEVPGAVFAIAGKRALTATTAVVTENWVVWTERDRLDVATSTYIGFWSPVPSFIVPSAVFRIAGNRLSWDIGAVVPLMIYADSQEGFSLNTPVIPIPILSITYRIR